MKKVQLDNKRDFPLTTNALKFIQEAYGDFEQLVKLGGDNYILSGCVITGSSVSTGWVVIGGLLMPFSGGVIQTNVRVVTTASTITVGRGIREQTSYNAEFGTSTNPLENITWASLSANRIVSSVEARSRLTTIETNLASTKRLVFAIGVWNMMSTSEVRIDLPTGFDITKVVALSAIVVSDSGSSRNFIYSRQDDGIVSGQLILTEGSPAQIYLSRNSAGPYNATIYDSASINRGYVEITYIP